MLMDNSSLISQAFMIDEMSDESFIADISCKQYQIITRHYFDVCMKAYTMMI